MYKLKSKLILQYTQKEFAKKVGITPEFMSEIQNGRKCSKLVAYSITKAYNENLEILDLFDRI